MFTFRRPSRTADEVSVGQESPNVEALVTLAYRAVLRRGPDPGGLATYTRALRDGHDLAWLIEQMITCDEFQSSVKRSQENPAQSFWFDRAPPMSIDAHCTPDELSALWSHVASTWSRFGENDAHWSVLTQDRYRADALGAEALAEFYATGEDEVSRLNTWLHRAGLKPQINGTCAEYGCGVGRVTHRLAGQHGQVLAIDVSEPHLQAARAWTTAEGIKNIDFVRIRGAADLNILRNLDAFYSVISLQHSPPPIIVDVLAHAFAALKPGGYAFFQVPTYSQNYSYSAAAHLARIQAGEADAEMEMHFVPQDTVLDLAHRAGLAVAEVQPDGAIGGAGQWISNTFLFVRK